MRWRSLVWVGAAVAVGGTTGCADGPAEARERARARAAAEASATATPVASLPAAPSSSSPVEPEAEPEAEPEPEPEPAGPCPPEMAHVAGFCVDRWEAHLVTIEDGVERPVTYTEPPPEGFEILARSSANRWPQPYISRVQAAQACQAAGKRLCTRREWTRACQGKSGRRYSYGHHEQRGTCNVRKDHLMPKVFGPDGRRWKYDEHFNSSLMAIIPGFLEKTAERTSCVSDEGVHDMVGNLHEWVSGIVDQDLVDELEGHDVPRREQPWTEGNGIFMGGFFSTGTEHGPGCAFITIAHEPAYHDYSTGFRCCAAPTPPSDGQPGAASQR